MFIRVKTTDSNDVNVNVNGIRSFQPQGDYSLISFNDGTSLQVTDSTRSLRGYVKKALFVMHTGGAAETEVSGKDDGLTAA